VASGVYSPVCCTARGGTSSVWLLATSIRSKAIFSLQNPLCCKARNISSKKCSAKTTRIFVALQAVHILDPQYEIINGDILATGALPSSGGALALHKRLLEQREQAEDLICLPRLFSSSLVATDDVTAQVDDSVAVGRSSSNAPANSNGASANGAVLSGSNPTSLNASGSVPAQSSYLLGDLSDLSAVESAAEARQRRGAEGVVEFYKAWDRWGALSNFSPHAIDMPRGQGGLDAGAAPSSLPTTGQLSCRWASVEHYYQAQKFSHAPGCVASDVAAWAEEVIDEILRAPSPEEAARVGRYNERMHPELVRPDWPEAKVRVMRAAVLQKFSQHAGPRTLLLSTAKGGTGWVDDGGLHLVEKSPNDVFWGSGRDGSGQNMLGKILQETRASLLGERPPLVATQATQAKEKQLGPR
jgi:ribA/ribD-fused uncharacterized protein